VTSAPPRASGDADLQAPIRLRVNGEQRVCADGAKTLGEWLRRDLDLTATKLSCEQGFCGACSVLVDGAVTGACSVLMCDLDGCDVLTVEGLGDGARLHPVQQAFLQCRGFQCGYCTPGMVMSAVALLAESEQPSDDEIDRHFEGNLCRCTGYVAIRQSVRQAAMLFQHERRGGQFA
jgi:aerobic-type carbon monoxide dehydrogenase small subunit (CoxS/CutS family)